MSPSLKNEEVLRGRYKVREQIGQGGAGSIYLADDLRLAGRVCALKEVEYDRALPENIREEARGQFLREATVLARLDHPNLPKVSDFFSNGIRDYLVMDYVPGDDLRTMMLNARREKRFLSEHDVLDWTRQLASALSYLHNQQPSIVHRDIKPSNLKITPTGLLKLVDFGLVKILAAPEEVTITVIQGQGTALYTPLEQYGTDESHTDARSDIYSFGATLYHLLTNEAPADARKRFLQPASLPPPRQINPSISPRTEKAILWAMALHPDDRPDSIQAFSDFLFSGREIPVRPRAPQSAFEIPQLDIFGYQADALLAWTTAGLLLVSLIATLIR
ncbi:MAG: serine/threonine protein kinase [Chloroflexi bacterium]|nr:serine/threonine protein kinase [Chloroflexota bacterium]MBI3340979.1 serine/threonine protein kinase [Chloroflexota bacterium]